MAGSGVCHAELALQRLESRVRGREERELVGAGQKLDDGAVEVIAGRGSQQVVELTALRVHRSGDLDDVLGSGLARHRALRVHGLGEAECHRRSRHHGGDHLHV